MRQGRKRSGRKASIIISRHRTPQVHASTMVSEPYLSKCCKTHNPKTIPNVVGLATYTQPDKDMNEFTRYTYHIYYVNREVYIHRCREIGTHTIDVPGQGHIPYWTVYSQSHRDADIDAKKGMFADIKISWFACPLIWITSTPGYFCGFWGCFRWLFWRLNILFFSDFELLRDMIPLLLVGLDVSFDFKNYQPGYFCIHDELLHFAQSMVKNPFSSHTLCGSMRVVLSFWQAMTQRRTYYTWFALICYLMCWCILVDIGGRQDQEWWTHYIVVILFPACMLRKGASGRL